MKRSNLLFVLKSFVLWRVTLILVAFFSIKYLPLFSENFLAGRMENYIKNPLFWGWANFDGEHYTSIAIYGYKDLQQAFFPAYPFLIKLLSSSADLINNIWSGLIISNLAFLASLTVFWKIVRLDFSEKLAKLSIISLLVFPTSFYFGAVYTESLFLLSSLLTYYLYRKEKYFFAGLVGILMTLTRVYGLFVLVMIFVDLLQRKTKLKDIFKKKIYLISLSFLGIASYMYYLFVNYSDPFAFYNLQTLVGEQHQKGIVLLPQVFYRYMKIFIEQRLPIYNLQTILLEFVGGLMFVFLPIFAYIKKVRWSYIVYVLLGFLVPSIQGSFSSVPRYVVVIFPAFIIMGLLLKRLPKTIMAVCLCLSAIWLAINCAMFFRGYWIS